MSPQPGDRVIVVIRGGLEKSEGIVRKIHDNGLFHIDGILKDEPFFGNFYPDRVTVIPHTNPSLLGTQHIGVGATVDGRSGVIQAENGRFYLKVRGDRRKYWVDSAQSIQVSPDGRA